MIPGGRRAEQRDPIHTPQRLAEDSGAPEMLRAFSGAVGGNGTRDGGKTGEISPNGETMLLHRRKLVARWLQVNMAPARRKRRRRRQRCLCSQLELRAALPSRRPRAACSPINYLSPFALLHEIFSPLPRELGQGGGQAGGGHEHTEPLVGIR